MADIEAPAPRPGSDGLLRLLGKAIDWLALAGGYLAGATLLMMTVGVTLDVLARYLLGAGTKAAIEMSGYALVAIVFLGLAYTHRTGGHIEIDFGTQRLPEAWRARLRVVNTLVFLGYTIMLGLFGWRSFWDSYDFGTTSCTGLDVEIWPYQLLISVGLAMASLLLARDVCSGIARGFRGRRKDDAS